MYFFAPENRQLFYETTGMKLPENPQLSYYRLINLNNRNRMFNLYLNHNTLNADNLTLPEYRKHLEKPDSLTPNGEGGIIETEPDVYIPIGIGAKTKNYNIELPNKEIVHLTEGTRVTNIKTIAGKGRERKIDEIDILVDRHGGSEYEWQKKKGYGYVDYEGESYLAELHWYEEPTIGKYEWKVKPDADGNWFIED